MTGAPGSGAIVAINARAAQRTEIGGVERWAREMAARLPTLRPERYRTLRPPQQFAHRAGHLWEQAALPALTRGAELIYSPANLAPAASARNVIVIHDVAALRHPDWYGRAYVAYQRLLLPLLARRARHLITVSEFARGELVAVLGADPARVSVVAPGVDERFSPAADPAAVRRRHMLEKPYVLTVGTQIARKNVAALARAAHALAAEGIELVAAGSPRHYMRADSSDEVRALGYVDDSDLPGLYAGARAFVLPSLYEGFGIPCLEAMASGTPVVASNRTALPEACGHAALLVDPEDPEAIAEALLTVATEDAERARMRTQGIERAADFSWQRAAERTDEVLASVLA